MMVYISLFLPFFLEMEKIKPVYAPKDFFEVQVINLKRVLICTLWNDKNFL